VILCASELAANAAQHSRSRLAHERDTSGFGEPTALIILGLLLLLAAAAWNAIITP
jgi:hypothetical protein